MKLSHMQHTLHQLIKGMLRCSWARVHLTPSCNNVRPKVKLVLEKLFSILLAAFSSLDDFSSLNTLEVLTLGECCALEAIRWRHRWLARCVSHSRDSCSMVLTSTHCTSQETISRLYLMNNAAKYVMWEALHHLVLAPTLWAVGLGRLCDSVFMAHRRMQFTMRNPCSHLLFCSTDSASL